MSDRTGRLLGDFGLHGEAATRPELNIEDVRTMLAEKRRGQRVLVNLRARYRSETVVMDGQIANLSRYGMFLRSEFLDDMGSAVKIELHLPDLTHPLHLDGEVVRVDTRPASSGMGIRFHGLSAPIRRALANFMIERSYRPPA